MALFTGVFLSRLAWYGAAKQNEFGSLIPYALFETMSVTLIYNLTDFPIKDQ